MEWGYFDRFNHVTDKYLPDSGEGETMATQIVAAVCKLVYKWYNDGDVFDNTYYLSGWWNDLSSYANWLYKYVPQTQKILSRIMNIISGEEYEDLLVDLADEMLDDEFLEKMNTQEKTGSIYDCEGIFHFCEEEEEDEEEEWEEEEDWEE